MPMEWFKYHSLAGSDHIRLLRVEYRPTEDRFTQRYTIIETQLAGAPPYQTVSYVWGDSKPRWPLELSNGSVIHVNDSIHTALPYLVAQCNSGYLWIDQVCIDQRNLSERSEQVAIMGEIYARAENCLVWLGEGTESTRVTIRKMVEIAGCGTQDHRLEREVSPRDVRVDAWIRNRKESVTEAMVELFSFPWVSLDRVAVYIIKTNMSFSSLRESGYCKKLSVPNTSA